MGSFRDRFFTPVVALAMTSPLGILAAGTGAGAGIIAGGGGLGSVVGGFVGAAALWAFRVAAAVPRGPERERIDTDRVAEPWRHLTNDALAARNQFHATVKRTRTGPIHDRLVGLGRRIDESVEEIWTVAQAGHELVAARGRIDVQSAQRDLQRVRSKQTAAELSPTTAATVRSLEAQLAAAARMDATIAATNDRLELLNARLDEAVASSIELSVGSSRPDEFRSVDDMVSSIADELDAIRTALDDTSHASVAAAAPLAAEQPQPQPQSQSQPRSDGA